MKEVILHGFKIRVSKYKVTIYDPNDIVTDDKATQIATYLHYEGFIDKPEFPVEVIKSAE